MEHWHWPQWSVAALYAFGIAVGIARHGKPRTGNYDVTKTALGTMLFVWLTWMGGFWS